MGEDLCLNILTWDKKRKLNWKAGEKYIKCLATDEDGTIHCPGGNETTKEQLTSYLNDVKMATKDSRRDAITIRLHHLNILVTGGMSWGDDPTDLFTSISILNEFSILEEVGFNQDEINYKAILSKLLEQKSLLPVIIGIDKNLDNMIEGRLK